MRDRVGAPDGQRASRRPTRAPTQPRAREPYSRVAFASRRGSRAITGDARAARRAPPPPRTGSARRSQSGRNAATSRGRETGARRRSAARRAPCRGRSRNVVVAARAVPRREHADVELLARAHPTCARASASSGSRYRSARRTGRGLHAARLDEDRSRAARRSARARTAQPTARRRRSDARAARSSARKRRIAAASASGSPGRDEQPVLAVVTISGTPPTRGRDRRRADGERLDDACAGSSPRPSESSDASAARKSASTSSRGSGPRNRTRPPSPSHAPPSSARPLVAVAGEHEVDLRHLRRRPRARRRAPSAPSSARRTRARPSSPSSREASAGQLGQRRRRVRQHGDPLRRNAPAARRARRGTRSDTRRAPRGAARRSRAARSARRRAARVLELDRVAVELPAPERALEGRDPAVSLATNGFRASERRRAVRPSMPVE